MTKLLYAALTAAVSLTISCGPSSSGDTVKDSFAFADGQLRIMLHDLDSASRQNDPAEGKPRIFPRSIEPDGSLRLSRSSSWTSGYFPGILWYMYEYTGEEFWKNEAWGWTQKMYDEQFNTSTHDVGFMINDSFGNAYRLTGDETARQAVINAARSLITRFDETAGCLRSWNPRGVWDFPVIIDNMMNLELLFNATAYSGDSTFYNIAVRHADTTMENHFREDFTCYHVIDYDTETGAVKHKHTHQGYSHDSSWARGQAWALYGFTAMYRFTGNIKYLTQAENIAVAVFSHPGMPEDLVPYWDFDAPSVPDEPRDVSAATIIASALYELSSFGNTKGTEWKKTADRITESVTAKYMVPAGTHHGFLLLSSTGNRNSNDEVDTPIIYADFYFLQALLRKQELDKTT